MILHYFSCYFSEIPPPRDFRSSISDRALTSKSDNINTVNMFRLLIAELDAVLVLHDSSLKSFCLKYYCENHAVVVFLKSNTRSNEVSPSGSASCTSGCHEVILHYFECYFSRYSASGGQENQRGVSRVGFLVHHEMNIAPN